jgi:general secretion pathway protein A
MYKSFYGFREKPFSLLPDPAFLFLGRKHRMALAMLEYGMMNQAGFTVITGEIGSGKTTLIRRLLGQIVEERELSVGLVSNAQQSFGELMQWVLLAFKLEYRGKEKVEMYQCLAEFMGQEYSQGRRTVLIIDEAQSLDPGTLEELRLLSNINADKDQILQLILVGQPELREKLRRPELTQFAQRIAVDFHLGVLDLQETCEYIRHRLAVAGGDPNLFEPEAGVAVHYYSRGTPRLTNIICDTTLVCAFAEQKKKIDADLVHDVMRDKSVGGLLPVWRGDNDAQDVVLDIQTAKKRGT